ncbi:MAG: diguanylate cyclase domain-containing protein [Aminivibrio sp.]
MKNKYRMMSVLIVLLSCIVAGAVFIIFDFRVEAIYGDSAREALLGAKKQHLRHTVKNQIMRINAARKTLGDDEKAKIEIAREIHDSLYPLDSYIWVNEVINYDGGPGYAVRRVHPNLRDTEGMLLSTEMTDIKGNKPYLAELEGVKKDGSLFFTYYFQRMNSEEISEKLTYAELYPDFNWIVAMGVHLDDINSAVENANIKIHTFKSHLIAFFMLALAALMGISALIVLFLERKVHFDSKKLLEEEANMDSLTGAGSRRAGAKALAAAFGAFKAGERGAPLLALFDIDNFKNVNDACGHGGGDEVLKGVVKRVGESVRISDKLFRWGGDEFLLVMDGVAPEKAPMVTGNVVKAVAAAPFFTGKRDTAITLSLGASFFNAGDEGYEDALKRADEALYRVKSSGRNRADVRP